MPSLTVSGRLRGRSDEEFPPRWLRLSHDRPQQPTPEPRGIPSSTYRAVPDEGFSALDDAFQAGGRRGVTVWRPTVSTDAQRCVPHARRRIDARAFGHHAGAAAHVWDPCSSRSLMCPWSRGLCLLLPPHARLSIPSRAPALRSCCADSRGCRSRWLPREPAFACPPRITSDPGRRASTSS